MFQNTSDRNDNFDRNGRTLSFVFPVLPALFLRSLPCFTMFHFAVSTRWYVLDAVVGGWKKKEQICSTFLFPVVLVVGDDLLELLVIDRNDKNS